MSAKTLVLILGPPAVGKMAVGRELERITGLPLLHNHMTIDLVLPFFEFGSPAFSRLVGSFRRRIFEEVAESDLPGLIFTWVWDFGDEGARDFVDSTVELFTARGGRAVFVELEAALDVRVARNETALRLQEKPSKRDVVASQARLAIAERRHIMNSVGPLPYPEHIRIDNTSVDPHEVANRVVEAFDLPRVALP